MAPPSVSESPSNATVSSAPRDNRRDREAVDLLALLGGNTAAFSSSVQSLIASQREELELAEQRRLHGALLRTMGLLAFGSALGCGVLLLMRGVVLGWTELLGGRVWLASIAAGLILLLAVLVAFLAATAYLGHLRTSEGSRPGQAETKNGRGRSTVTRRTLF